jgi:hypothetical protein
MPPADEAFFDREADAVAVDLYTLPADAGEAAPDHWRQRIKFLGPGVIISAAIVGSGEIILTASLGAAVVFSKLLSLGAIGQINYPVFNTGCTNRQKLCLQIFQ